MDAISQATNRRKFKVLVVDDAAFWRRALSRMVAETGLQCEVIAVEDGLDACLCLKDFRPNLIVLDIDMPQLDGAELCHVLNLSGRLAETPVLIVTGRPEDPRVKRALDAGAAKCLAKSADPVEFRATVRLLLTGGTARAETR